VAFARPALHEDGKKIDCADKNDIDGEPLIQPVHQHVLWLWVRARAAEECESDCETEQQGYGNENRPNRHVDSEYRAADIFVTGAREKIQQGLANGNHEQQDSKDEAYAGTAFGGAGTKLQGDPEAASEHCEPLQKTERARDFSEGVLHDHCRRQDASQDQQHKAEDQTVQRDGDRGFYVLASAHGSAAPKQRKDGRHICLEPGHAEAVVGAVDFPQKEPDAQNKGKKEASDSRASQPRKVKDEREQ
jgi:hypothetical protein